MLDKLSVAFLIRMSVLPHDAKLVQLALLS